jgi:hypothetical protein
LTERPINDLSRHHRQRTRDEDIERLSPLGRDHIALTGRYRILLPAPLQDRSAYRALNIPEDAAAA